MEYRTSFLFSIVANFFDFMFGLLQYLVFFSAAKSIANWNSYEILTLYSVFMNIFALHFIFLYPNLVEIGEMVNSGKLDLILTKPISSQLVLSFKKISLQELGSLLTANVLLLWLFFNGHIQASFINFSKFFVAIICSMSIVYAMFLFLMSLAIKIEKLDNMSNLMWSIFSFCRYPVGIYPKWLKLLFTSLIPIAFVSTVPARTLLGTESWQTIILGICLTITMLILSRVMWVYSLKGYSSAGG